jgi:uncharacterized protein DUF4055
MSIWGWLPTFKIPNLTGIRGTDDSAAAESPTVQAWKKELWICRTLYGGWEAVQRERQNLLPQHPSEDNGDYQIRVCRPTFYNAFGRTVRALAGTVFQKPPIPDGVPQEIQKLYDDDIDLQGTAGDAFLLHTFNDALITGLSGIFVDMPQNTGGLTKLEAQQLDIRPFWNLICKDDIVSFRVDVVNGKSVLGQLVFRESVEERSGEFGVKVYDRYRVFRRTVDAVTFENWEKAERTAKLRRVGPVGQFRGVTEIPFAPIYTARVDFMDATPPLIDLAHLNLLHYQVNSDLHHAAHIANVPILFGVGVEADEIQVGPNRAVLVPDKKPEEATLRWVETLGASLGSTRSILADIEEQMSNLGLGMLQRKSRAAETAQKASLDRQEQDSTLAAIVSDLENGIELALFYTAQFMGLDDGGRLEFSRDFQLDPASADRTTNQGGAAPPRDPNMAPPPDPARRPVPTAPMMGD